MDDPMAANRSFRTLALALLAPTLPVAGVYVYHFTTGAPLWQPMASTRAEIAAYAEDPGAAVIHVLFEWGEAWPAPEQRAWYEARVTRAVAARTDDYAIQSIEVPGQKVRVSFTVGDHHIGPLAPAEVVDGLQDAVIAHNLYLYLED